MLKIVSIFMAAMNSAHDKSPKDTTRITSPELKVSHRASGPNETRNLGCVRNAPGNVQPALVAEMIAVRQSTRATVPQSTKTRQINRLKASHALRGIAGPSPLLAIPHSPKPQSNREQAILDMNARQGLWSAVRPIARRNGKDRLTICNLTDFARQVHADWMPMSSRITNKARP